ncbi:uncharacterized protein [Apostichopus japonicus]|uniref:uncharacterized protein isoform X2 n=1 Tax=Stichopus japonicus TaxID=307972 RepID=UPI003AB40512
MGDEELGKLFIGGVDKNTRPEEFRSLFENKGQIDDIVLMKDATMPDRNRGFGFVKFRDPSSAEELLNDPEPLVLNGKTLDVKACRQRDSQQKQDGAGQPDSPNKIFVGGLPQTCSEETLKNSFSAYGEVQHVKIMKDRNTGNLRGFAFVTFATAEPVQKLIDERFVQCDGKSVECKAAEHRYRFQGPDGGRGNGFGYGGGGGQGGGFGGQGGGNWQAQGGQGDGYQYNNAGAWGGQQQPMSNYNQAGYGRGQSSGGQWNQSYGGGYGSSQQQQQQQPSSQYGGGYTSAQTQGYGDQYSQGAAYNANQGYSANYSGAYGTTQPQQSQYGSQAATGYSAQGSYGAGYANTSNNYGQQTQQQQTAVPDPNSSGGPMRGSGYGQRVGNNTHGYHPYGK